MPPSCTGEGDIGLSVAPLAWIFIQCHSRGVHNATLVVTRKPVRLYRNSNRISRLSNQKTVIIFY